MRTVGCLVLLGLGVVLCGAATAEELANKEFRLKLDAKQPATPLVAEAARPGGEPAFRGTLSKAAWDAWLAEILPGGERRDATPWTVKAGPIFQQAECSERVGDLRITWRVELADEGSTFRIGATLDQSTGLKLVDQAGNRDRLNFENASQFVLRKTWLALEPCENHPLGAGRTVLACPLVKMCALQARHIVQQQQKVAIKGNRHNCPPGPRT